MNTGSDDFDWHHYGQYCVGDTVLPENGEEWIDQVSETALESLYQYNEMLNLPDVNILLANKLQMVTISMILRQILSVAKNENPEQLLLLLVGTAGTGKTYIVKVVTRIVRRIFNRNGAVLNLAPTGASSVLLPNGRTMHSITPIPRNSRKKDLKNAQLSDYPMSDSKLKVLRKITGTDNDRKVHLLNIDERGMTSHNDAAWCSQRMKEATENDNPFGGIPVVCWVGDHGQLGPVNASDLHITPKSSASPAEQAGFALYRHFQNVIYLKGTMRQSPDQKPLLETLLRIRRGEIIQHDWISIDSRFIGDLPPEERCNFEHNNVITLCETWNEVDLENHKKLHELGGVVDIVPAVSKGTHMQGKYATKQGGQIPPRSLLAVGSRVILMKNQKGLTGHGLNNGAIGKVVAIIYDPDTSPPAFPRFVIVDFPNYKGPYWCRENPTWIPIRAEDGFCDYMCCTRTGIPLMPGYSMPIAKSQGSTIGSKEQVTHLKLKLQKESNFET